MSKVDQLPGRRYEQIGHGYAIVRREDPRIAAVIEAALGDARTVVERVVARLRADLQSGTWDARHGGLRRLSAYDAGLRLVVSSG